MPQQNYLQIFSSMTFFLNAVFYRISIPQKGQLSSWQDLGLPHFTDLCQLCPESSRSWALPSWDKEGGWRRANTKGILQDHCTGKAPPSIFPPSQINSDSPTMADLHGVASKPMAQKAASTYSSISSYTLASSASN